MLQVRCTCKPWKAAFGLGVSHVSVQLSCAPAARQASLARTQALLGAFPSYTSLNAALTPAPAINATDTAGTLVPQTSGARQDACAAPGLESLLHPRLQTLCISAEGAGQICLPYGARSMDSTAHYGGIYGGHAAALTSMQLTPYGSMQNADIPSSMRPCKLTSLVITGIRPGQLALPALPSLRSMQLSGTICTAVLVYCASLTGLTRLELRGQAALAAAGGSGSGSSTSASATAMPAATAAYVCAVAGLSALTNLHTLVLHGVLFGEADGAVHSAGIGTSRVGPPCDCAIAVRSLGRSALGSTLKVLTLGSGCGAMRRGHDPWVSLPPCAFLSHPSDADSASPQARHGWAAWGRDPRLPSSCLPCVSLHECCQGLSPAAGACTHAHTTAYACRHPCTHLC